MINRNLFVQLGGFNEKLKIALNDVDLCLRAVKHGYRNVWTPYAELVHHEAYSRGADLDSRRKVRLSTEISYFRRRWRKYLTSSDPFYNPNLSLKFSSFVLGIL